MRVLINLLGITDSGGVVVLSKLLSECTLNSPIHYLLVYNKNPNVEKIISELKSSPNFQFLPVENKGFLHRLYLENIWFRKIVNNNNIRLVYNFSGTGQFFLSVPQLIKIQNLVFYSKKLDEFFKSRKAYFAWFKQVLCRRWILRLMLSRAQYFEIQSSHVKDNLLEYFPKLKNRKVFVKSDIDASNCLPPKNYDFTRKIRFLYIVGPHFVATHKNFKDFVNAMLSLNQRQINFEVVVTLSRTQLEQSDLWHTDLNGNTSFLGYISDPKKIPELFNDNTILISTSIIETLGLHVIDAIKNGIIAIVPNEPYAKAVYGKDAIEYDLQSEEALLNAILKVLKSKANYSKHILLMQKNLKKVEDKKYQTNVAIFKEILNDN